jgi:hypothetical protein
MKAYVFAGVFFCCSVTTAQAQNCYVPGFSGVDNSTAIGYMTVKAGKICGVTRIGGDGMMVTGTRIVGRPRAGKVGLTPTAIRYMPQPGYVGPDAFTFQNQGRNRFGQATVRTIRMQVNVVP